MSKAGGEGEGLRYAALVFDADVLEARLPRALPAPRPGAASIVAISELRQRIGIPMQDTIGMRNGVAVFVLAIARLDRVLEHTGHTPNATIPATSDALTAPPPTTTGPRSPIHATTFLTTRRP